jgi:HSP20 family protein
MLPVLSRQNSALGWPSRLSMANDWFDREFGLMVRNVFGGDGSSMMDTAVYPIDMWEDDDNVYVEAEVPGFTKDEIDVTIEQGTLQISAQRDQEKQQKDGSPVLSERTSARYFRSISLPASVQDDNVSATCDNGVLHLTLPKRPEVKPRRIKVK